MKSPWTNYLALHVHGIGVLTHSARAKVGDYVQKSGRSTEITPGSVLSTDSSVKKRVVGLSAGLDIAIFTNQIQCSGMSEDGDSGSILVKANSSVAVGLIFAGTAPNPDVFTHTYANHFDTVLKYLNRELTVKGADGQPVVLPKEEWSLVCGT